MRCIAGLGAPGAYAYVLVQVAHVRKAASPAFKSSATARSKSPAERVFSRSLCIHNIEAPLWASKNMCLLHAMAGCRVFTPPAMSLRTP